jgi:hypothetical protein
MQVVPRTRTPVALQAIPDLIGAAFRQLGAPLSPVQRVNLAALVALETDRGRAVQNGNLGNITARADHPGMVWRPPWFELTPTSSPRDVSLHSSMLAGRAPSAFRAYASVQDGALDFARFLLSPRYAHLLAAADSTDVDAFRVALTRAYSSDYSNPAATRSLAQLVTELGGTSSTSSGGAVALVVLLGVAWWVGSQSHVRTRRASARRRKADHRV